MPICTLRPRRGQPGVRVWVGILNGEAYTIVLLRIDSAPLAICGRGNVGRSAERLS